MPHEIRTLAAAAALLLLLASCSLVEDLVGPQQVSDPLGLHDVPVTLAPTAAPAAGSPSTALQATTTYGASFGPAEVQDIDTAGIPDWFDPDSLSIDVGIMSTVLASSASTIDPSEFSETLVLDRATLAELTIVDDDGDPRVVLDPVSTPAAATVTLVKQECSVALQLTCSYEAESGLDAFVMPVYVAGTAMNSLYAILSGGAPTNTASGTFRLTATGTVPADTTITVRMDAPSGTLDP